MAELQKNNKFLPKNFGLKSFAALRPRPEKEVEGFEKVYKYLLNRHYSDNKSVWISGEAGVGKTHLMIATLLQTAWHYWHDNENSLRGNFKYWNYSDLCGVLRQSPNDFDLLHSVRRVRFLFIDDVGVSKSSDFMQDRIYSIFNYRCENDLPTITTTNLKSSEIGQEFTERLTSRIKESGFWFELKGKDYRNKIYAENLNTLNNEKKV